MGSTLLSLQELLPLYAVHDVRFDELDFETASALSALPQLLRGNDLCDAGAAIT